MLGLAARVLDDPELSGSVAGFVAGITADAAVNSLGAKLVQLTMPGVPDVYQGCELAALSLVDPDNRRPVGFARARSDLTALDASPDASLRATSPAGTSTTSAGRSCSSPPGRCGCGGPGPSGSPAGYEPLTATGPAAAHVIAFRRGGQAVTVVTRLPVSLRRRGRLAGHGAAVARRRLGGPADRRRAPGRCRAADRADGRLPVALLVPGG